MEEPRTDVRQWRGVGVVEGGINCEIVVVVVV